MSEICLHKMKQDIYRTFFCPDFDFGRTLKNVQIISESKLNSGQKKSEICPISRKFRTFIISIYDVLVPDIHNVQQKSLSRHKTDIILAEYVRYDIMYRTLIMFTECPSFGHSKCPTRSPLFLVKKYPLGVLILQKYGEYRSSGICPV